jgi:hypothetical protein
LEKGEGGLMFSYNLNLLCFIKSDLMGI